MRQAGGGVLAWRCWYLVNLLKSHNLSSGQQQPPGAGPGPGAEQILKFSSILIHHLTSCSVQQCGDTGDMQRAGQSFVKLCTETPAPVPRRTLLMLLDHLGKRKVDICHDCDCPDCRRAVLVDTPIRILWVVETGNM